MDCVEMPRDEGRRQKREARRSLSAGGGQSVWRRFRNPLPALALLGDDELGKIDDTALRILEELGLEFQNPRAIDILANSGADVDRSIGVVRMDRHLVRELVAKAPSSFTLHARNPERNVIMGEDWINFAPVAGPPNVSDIDGGRRPGAFADQCNLIKLHQCLNELHLAGAHPWKPSIYPRNPATSIFIERRFNSRIVSGTAAPLAAPGSRMRSRWRRWRVVDGAPISSASRACSR
jgi:trimethylamine--corrinoid protein Co-methyltransferase